MDQRGHQSRSPPDPARQRTAWQNIILPIGPAALTSVGGFDLNATLGGVTELRILHNPTSSYLGAVVSGSLLLDNVTAVPEPGSVLLLGGALAGLCWMLRRSSQ